MSKDNTPLDLTQWLATWLQIREQLAGQIEHADRRAAIYGRYGQATIDAVDAALIDLEALARLLATGGNGRGVDLSSRVNQTKGGNYVAE